MFGLILQSTEYLSNKLQSQGIIGYPYSKLVGDSRDYWFLDTKKIANQQLLK
ncbi:DUF2316 family protein [Leuconostoc falkenbergense]|nr:DUF2316 family protein [Leuconostoc falkenbergense]MDV3546416.1 DUF2316 family protein [Leuconostoc falkenbergense]